MIESSTSRQYVVTVNKGYYHDRSIHRGSCAWVQRRNIGDRTYYNTLTDAFKQTAIPGGVIRICSICKPGPMPF